MPSERATPGQQKDQLLQGHHDRLQQQQQHPREQHELDDVAGGQTARHVRALVEVPGVDEVRPCVPGQQAGKGDEQEEATEEIDPGLLARAVRFLYTRETRSSFEIEGESPTASREERFVQALASARDADPRTVAALAALQGQIVDRRFAATGWRTEQNYVGRTAAGYREVVDFVCPKPDDVGDLMAGWATTYDRLTGDQVHATVAAAVLGFAFVFIHPFLDANGRVHRWLIHHVLARRGFGPENVILPVSSSILRDRRGYGEVLESFSRAISPFIEWDLGAERNLTVRNDTAYLYRTFDATRQVEHTFVRNEKCGHSLQDELSGQLSIDELGVQALPIIMILNSANRLENAENGRALHNDLRLVVALLD